MLRGRGRELELIERHLEHARRGQSAVLVLRGEAGIGKTALLEHVAERASGCQVARAAGVQSEMELAFAGLHQLCGPMLDDVARLPLPQREALRVAFGLQEGEAPDRFLVGLAVLSLLAEVADERPLVCLIDDVQWIDQVSVQLLQFVARRLLAEPIAMVFAIRESDDGPQLTGLPEIVVEGLADAEARGAARRGPAGTDRRARTRADHRRGARQPARSPGAPPQPDARRARGRLRHARLPAARGPYRAHLPPPVRGAAGGLAAARAGGRGGIGG